MAKLWIQLTAAIALVVAGLIGVSGGSCNTQTTSCPSYALGQPLVLDGERTVVLLLIFLALLVFISRTIIDGDLPDSLGQGWVSWSKKAAKGTRKAMTALEAKVEIQRDALEVSNEAIGAELTTLSERLDNGGIP
jgi:hypothetical protein